MDKPSVRLEKTLPHNSKVWQSKPLGEFINLKRGYDLPARLREEGQIPIFTSSGISGNHSLAKCDPPGVITGRYGTVGLVFHTDTPYWPHNTALYVQDFKGNDSRFVFYLLKTLDWEKYSDKSAVPGVNRNEVHREQVSFPELPEQLAIVGMLCSLDDKIDLLHRQNKTLEAMAETLFRHWFVEEANVDWKEGTLGQFVDIGIGRTPPRKEFHWFSRFGSDVKWISIKDLSDSGLFVFDTAEYLTRDAVKTFSIPVIPPRTVVLSFKMTVGRVAITTEPMLSNEAIAHFRFTAATPFSVEYLYFFLKRFKYDVLGTTSSIVTSINSKMIRELPITIPSAENMKQFQSTARSTFEKIRSNQMQIRTLEKLRDMLLPKLMSGDVRVQHE